ncbi:transposase family protein [Nonomuraea sp. SYSU D8015]|uniref:transposase family protein n=1 Tax=Nonomuraea sp. SYSU D8015 TaxID=2593644 RepID=UPI001660A06F
MSWQDRHPASRTHWIGPGRRPTSPDPGRHPDEHRSDRREDQREGKEIDAWYSGKARASAANLQGLMTPGGFPIWISDALPGSTHDITAAREQVLATMRPYLKDMPLPADSGYEGSGAGVHVPVKQPADGRELDVGTRTRNALPRSLRVSGRTRLRVS